MNEQEAFEAWFRGEQGKPYDGAYTFAEASWHAALAWLRSQGEPVAWLFDGRKPGQHRQFASVDSSDSQTWPIDDGVKWTKTPLYAAQPPAIPDGWQPIETMPKDFEPFDVWSARIGRIPDCTDGVTTYGKKRGIVFQSGYDSDGPVMDLVEDATHWMRVAAPEPSK